FEDLYGEEGEHRAGAIIGLRPLHHILRCATGLTSMEFDWRAVADEFLDGQENMARDREWRGFFRWLSAIASGELTRADLRL
ncbi:MAG: hypothetical protein V1723_00260, partial [Candidatus Uhrbacteria bacterium]